MNRRTISIIHELKDAGRESSIGSLAEKFGVSQRTIRNDLKEISDILRENHLQELCLKRGGIICCGDDFEQILSVVSEGDFYTYKLSKEERIREEAVLLVKNPGYVTLSEIANCFFVSRATVINDLDAVKEYVKQGNLKVVSYPNKGLRLEGSESDRVNFLSGIK